MKIYEMEASKSGNFFLAAEFEKKVAAYESVTGKNLASTILTLNGEERECALPTAVNISQQRHTEDSA